MKIQILENLALYGTNYGHPKYNLWQFWIQFMNTVTNLVSELVVSTGQSDHTFCCQGTLLLTGQWKYLLLYK